MKYFKKLKDLSETEYIDLLDSGMLWEMFPEASGKYTTDVPRAIAVTNKPDLTGKLSVTSNPNLADKLKELHENLKELNKATQRLVEVRKEFEAKRAEDEANRD